jgi:hypothetical protein
MSNPSDTVSLYLNWHARNDARHIHTLHGLHGLQEWVNTAQDAAERERREEAVAPYFEAMNE